MLVINEKLEDELEVQTDLMDEPEKLTVIAKVTHPLVRWSWYLICFNDTYQKQSIYTILEGEVIEYGVIGLDELNTQIIDGFPFEIDNDFNPCNAQELFLELKKITV